MTPTRGKEDPVIFFTKIRFILTLGLLAILATGAFMLLIYEVKRAEHDALVITTMENQWGFIHKANFLASEYAQSNTPPERQILRKEVHEALSLTLVFTSNQPASLALSSLPADLQRTLYRLYCHPPSRLNDEILDYINSVKNFMIGTPVHVSSDYPQLRALNAKTLRVLSMLRGSVRQYQRESLRRIVFLKNLGIVFFASTLLALLTTGALTFIPILRKIRGYLDQLKNVNQTLEKKVRERTLELEQKAVELSASNQQLQDEVQERLRAENNLRNANVFLDSVIENIPDMIFIKDANELRFVRFNRAGEQLLGYSRKELIGKNDYCFFPREQADFFIQKDRDTLKNKVLLEITEEPINTLKKGSRILHTKKIPILDEAGNPIYLLGISEDITQRIMTEKQLEENMTAMENALDGIARLDKNMNFLMVNKAYAAMLGYTPEEMTGLNLFSTISQEDQNKVKTASETLEKTGKLELEVKALRKDKSMLHQFLVLIPPGGENKFFDGFHCFARDITEHKYRESVEIKSDLIQMVSHELRTPIHSVKEGINIVLEGLTGPLNAEQRETLEISKRCADRLTRLVNDVLAFHKLDAGVIEFRIKKTDINALVCDVAESMGPLVKEKNLRFEVKTDASVPAADMDPDKIVQVITNFLQNAIKFTSQGSITLSTAFKNNRVVVSVQDTGIGIQQKDLPKIFKKFSQLESAQSIAPGGTGLGLAISKKIVETHHGTVSVESEYKKGSLFSFSLPLSQPVTNPGA
ncbi:MAG: PAS domain S-box protein [Candidatus Omnitrophota bacterium]|jgi:PAS domain S-box-containing protein